jgi:long-chain acyl-CoA synthetase
MPSAFIQPNFLYLKGWCQKKNIPYTTNREMASHKKVVDRIRKEVRGLNKSFSSFEQIKKYELIGSEWTIEGGELTPTLKLKRKFILEKYQDLYRKIYSQNVVS